jgi:hypothetical protein
MEQDNFNITAPCSCKERCEIELLPLLQQYGYTETQVIYIDSADSPTAYIVPVITKPIKIINVEMQNKLKELFQE